MASVLAIVCFKEDPGIDCSTFHMSTTKKMHFLTVPALWPGFGPQSYLLAHVQ